MMDLEEFRNDMLNTIRATSQSYETHPSVVFLEDYCRDVLINDYGLISDLTVFSFSKPAIYGFKGMGLDGWNLETSTNTLTLVWADYTDGEMATFNTEVVNNGINQLLNFVSNVFKRYFDQAADSNPVTDLAHDLLTYQDDIITLRLIFASTNKKNDALMKRSWNMEPHVCGAKKFNVDVVVLDIQNIYESQMVGEDRERVNIDTKDYGYPEGIPCIKAEVESPDYDSYLGIVPGQFLADIYIKYNARLLESNVRSYLSARGAINKGIQSTILNERSRFFAYNNGIATTADSIEFAPGSKDRIVRFNNFQIINGGQTTASLASAFFKDHADLSGIYVQMKLSIIKNQDDAADIVMLISKYANKQNKVTNADLNSNHPYFKRIKELSDTIKTPQLPNTPIQTLWFFERSRGQYDQARMLLKTKGERDNFERLQPKDHKFTKSDLAKYLNASDELRPYDVACGAEVNLTRFQENIEKTWDKKDVSYNEHYYKDLIAKAIIYKRIDKIVATSEWYQNDRAYKNAIVPYTFAKFVYEAKKINMKPNYQKVWNQQECIREYEKDFENISYLVYKAFNDPSRYMSNIGEYAKREVCWKAVMDVPYNLTQGTINNLVTPEESADKERAARKDQGRTNSASSEIEIFKAGVDYWQKVLNLDEQLKVLNYMQRDLCKIAIRYCKGETMLTDYQIKELSNIMKIMRSYNIS